MPRQQNIDWDRGAQLAALNSLDLPDRLVGNGRRVSRMAVMSVLRIIDDCQREKSSAWPSLATIGERAGCSKRTVSAAINCLESLGLLTVWEERHNRAPMLVMAINWLAVFSDRPAETSTPKIARSRPKRRPRQGDTLARQGDTLARQGDTLARQGDTLAPPQYRNRIEPPKEPSPPSPPTRKPLTWEEVEEELNSRGVSQFAGAVATARRSVTPAHVAELLAWYDAHAERRGLTPGALYLRVCKAREWLAIHDGWPEGSGRVTGDQRREALRQDTDARRETEFGPRLDQLTPAELLDLAKWAGGSLPALVAMEQRSARTEPDLRRRLLQALESQLTPAEAG